MFLGINFSTAIFEFSKQIILSASEFCANQIDAYPDPAPISNTFPYILCTLF